MKTFSIALAVILVTTASSFPADTVTTLCCTAFVSRPIRPQLLTSYSYTSESCPFRAVVFVTKRGRSFCADPNDEWVLSTIRFLETK
ncbi:C-C motif chemokine 5-like [Tiliqua scincoides]|uniref:C-C motif chemokine 5-like n=1 Tax=Tiliqua scincoides TaxID=71010 RepID=UPI00346291CE